jgi:hypothetical protein
MRRAATIPLAIKVVDNDTATAYTSVGLPPVITTVTMGMIGESKKRVMSATQGHRA